MLCQKCGLAGATVHRYTTVFRQQIEEHLCALCAGSLGAAESEEPASHIMPQSPVPVVANTNSDFTFGVRRLRRVVVRRPIVLRDLAAALGLAPFKLISELNQLVGFAAMNSKVEDSVAQRIAEKLGFQLTIGDD